MSEAQHNVDCGLEALALLLRFHGVAVDKAQIEHQLGGARVKIPEMLRCAKALKLKARSITADWSYLQKAQFPAIAECRNNDFVTVGKISDREVLVHVPSVGRPQLMTRSEFESEWTGRIVLMARRASLGDLARRFDVTWFLQAMHKYRRMFVEV